MEDDRKKKTLGLINLKMMLTLAGAGIIIVSFYLLVGKFSVLLSVIGKLIKAVSPIIIGMIIAFILNPIVNRMRMGFRSIFENKLPKMKKEKREKLSDVLAVIFALIFFLVILVGFLWVLIPSLYESINNLYANFDKYTTNMEKYITNLMKDNPDIMKAINNYMDDIEAAIKKFFTDKLLPNMDSIVMTISSGIISGVKFVLNFIIGIIAAVYILLSKDKFSAQAKKFVYAAFERKTGNKILYASEYVDAVFGGFISGKLIDSLIIGGICFVFCRIVNMPYAVLISVIIGVTNIIPFFGPFIGAIPSAFLVLVESPKMCLIFVIFIIILQQIDGNIIGPLILSDSTGLSSFWVLFAILVGGNLFGFAGMILGVPTFACIYAIMTIWLRNNLNKRGLKNDTEYFVALRGFDEDDNPIRGPKKRFASARDRKKREKNLESLRHSMEFIDNLTHHDKDNDKKDKTDKSDKKDKSDKNKK